MLPFICLPLSSSVCLLVCLSTCLLVYLSVCLSVCLSNCLSVCLSNCLSVCLSICLCGYLSVCLRMNESHFLSLLTLSTTSPLGDILFHFRRIESDAVHHSYLCIWTPIFCFLLSLLSAMELK